MDCIVQSPQSGALVRYFPNSMKEEQKRAEIEEIQEMEMNLRRNLL